MTEKYLLPCSCGKAVPITVAQAGSKVTCECGTALDVPKMRELCSLKRTGGSDEPTPRASDYTGVTPARVFFTVCLSIALLAATAALLLYVQRSKLDLGPTDQQLRQIETSTIDNFTPNQSMELWRNFVKTGLNPSQGSFWKEVRQQHAQLTAAMKGSLLIAGLGFLSAVMSAMLTKPGEKTSKS